MEDVGFIYEDVCLRSVEGVAYDPEVENESGVGKDETEGTEEYDLVLEIAWGGEYLVLSDELCLIESV